MLWRCLKKTRQPGSSGKKIANQNRVSWTNQKNSFQLSKWKQRFPSLSDSCFTNQSEKFVSAQRMKTTFPEPIGFVIISSRKHGSRHVERTNQNWVFLTNQKQSLQKNVKRVFPEHIRINLTSGKTDLKAIGGLKLLTWIGGRYMATVFL